MNIPPPVAPVLPPSRFVKRGGYMVCLMCNMVADYCRCASQPPADAGSKDGDESGLRARIAEVVRKREATCARCGVEEATFEIHVCADILEAIRRQPACPECGGR